MCLRALILLLVFASGNCLMRGAEPTANSATNSFIVWNTEEKDELLPQSSVIAMTQTRDGYLWLGTMKGLARFDGMRAERFDALGSSTIVHLFEDRQRGLYVGTENAGVVLVKNGQVQPLPIGGGGIESRLVASCEDATGAVWLFTASAGLYRVRGGAVEAMQVTNDWRWPACRTLIAETNGDVLVGTDNWVRRINPRATDGSFATITPVTNLNLLVASPRGGYWQLANGRVQKWNANGLERDAGAYGWTKQSATPVTVAREDLAGNLYVGTFGDGVYRYAASGEVTHIASPILNHNTVLSLCLDREGSLWVGTDGGGANRVKPQRFELQPDSAGKTVQLVTEARTGGLWFSYNGGAFLNFWNHATLQSFGSAQGLVNVNVRAVLEDHRGTVWVGGTGGSAEGGLFQLEGGRFRPAIGTESVRPHVVTLFEDRATNVWVGMLEGLARWDGSAWRIFTTRDGLSTNSVRALAEDGAGSLWIGTDGGGLNRLRNDRFESYRASPGGLPGDSISALLADPDGTLWVGTDGNGLARWRNGNWIRYARRDGLAGNSIAYLLDDGAGFLWIGSNEGLMRVAKSALNDFAEHRLAALPVRTFQKADGLPTKECTSGSQPAACRTRDGKLWFPTTKGLVSVSPAQLAPNPNPPPVIIESVLVDDQPQNTNTFQVTWTDDIIVPASKERVDIHYTSLNLAAPERARFKYRLADHETQWTDAGELRAAHYPKLPPGRYHFMVTACNEDGVWNPNPAVVTIVVEPPFWKTGWFLTLATLGLLGAVVGTVYFISTQKLQRQLALMRQQEALEKERARIARDLHDQLGANLTQVALLGEMAESDKDLPTEVESHAQMICQTARETSRALDEIVWAANPANDTLEGLVNYTCKYAQDYLALAGVRYRLEVPPTLPAAIIPPDLRHNVFLAFKESVNNVVKHAQATEARIRLRLDAGTFTFEIEDNGRGLPPDAANKGRNGLRNMRKRMEDVGGGFALEPGPERGTVVRLTAPLGKG